MIEVFRILVIVSATAVPFLLVGIKWEFPWGSLIRRLLIFLVLNLIVCQILRTNLLLSLAITWILLAIEVPLSILPFFYRDPDRKISPDENEVVSPADGHIVYVKDISDGQIPLCMKKGDTFTPDELSGISGLAQEGILVGIGMTFLDVHVTRVPISGKVKRVVHTPGKFISLKDPEAVIRNERASVAIETPRLTYAIILIASRLVRRIETYLNEGDTAPKGERLGIIKFGSQVDIILPSYEIESINVKEGDIVQAGITKIASLKPIL